MFACHQTHEGAELPCAGWLAMVGHRHPNVRLALIQGHLPAEALRPGPDWPTLHDSYDDVLNKLMESGAPEEQRQKQEPPDPDPDRHHS